MIYFRMNTFLITLFFAWITVSSHPADSVQTKFGSKEIQIGVGGFGPTLQKAISALNERNKKANNIEKDEPIQTESFSQEKEDGEEENPSETETVSPSEEQTESTSPTTTTTTTVSSSDTTTQQTTTDSSVDETTVTITTTAKTELPELSPSPGTTTLRPEQNNGSKMNPSLVLQMGIFFLTITYLLELKL